MAYSANPHILRRLYDSIIDAGLAGELADPARRVAVLRKMRNQRHGQVRRILDRVLALDADQQVAFFDNFLRGYGI